MTPTPRKARSGRRQFGPSPGTEQEWAKVMASPHVQRAFQDPNIQQALMQHMQQQAAAGAPAAPEEPVAMATGGALHFDTGGAASTIELQNIMQQIATMPEGPQKDQLRMRAATLQSQQSPGAMPLPGGGTASASTMGGINSMVKPPTVGNTALAAGMGALQGLGTTSHQGMSALLGAGLSGALSYLIRKYGKNAQKPPGSTPPIAGGGYTPTPEPQGGATPGGTTSAAPSPTSGGATEVPVPEPWKKDPWKKDSQADQPPSPSVKIPDTGPPGASPPGAGRLMMGTANSDSGNVISRDGGKTWADQKTPDTPYTGVVVNQSQIDPGSSLNSAVPAFTPPPPSPASDPSVSGWGYGFAEGGPVEPQEPQGLAAALGHKPMPVPVLRTTIVIAAKPKKKATDKGPIKAKAQDEDRPRAHGRVQVPRGSGAAIKGKRFGGIF